MRKIKLYDGEIAEVKDVMIDVDGTNLSEGVDINVGGKYLSSIVGAKADEVTEDMIDLLME
jgi:hypothetical protein